MTNATSIPATMKAIRLHSPGGIDNLSYDEVPTPTPVEGKVLVRIHAAAITRDELDWPTDRLPAIPSYEMSGTVVDDGATTGFEPGQAVYALTDFERDGVAAEYALIPASELSPKPASLTHPEAAAIPLPALSAMQGLFDHAGLTKNERVLIHGAAGGVGAYATQLARKCGAYVIATASTERVDTARQLGADEVIDHTQTDFTTLDPVDLVFDTGGGDRLLRSIKVLKPGGRLISVAEDPPLKECEQAGIDGRSYLVESNQQQLAELSRLFEQDQLQVIIDRTYPLADAREAFEHLQRDGGRGKVVLTVREQL